MIDKYELLSVIAPIAAPAAPATMLINILYADLMREAVNSNFAIGAAIASGIGAEASGMIAAYVGIQAYRKRKYGLMLVAILAFIAYAGFMALGISAAKQPLAMVSTIIISIIAYVAVALFTDLRGVLAEAQAETDMEISLMKAKKDLTNAETRKLKTGATFTQTSTQTGGNIAKLSPAKIAEIQDYWRAHPNATYQDVSLACGVSKVSAGKYKP